jgi:hypothetical protein
VAAGEPLAIVTAAGSGGASTRVLAAHAIHGPSLGWRLRHIF